ncbi:hypothetical protein D3P09_02490 [Paenibacillus pinisoli]|uniref:Uncharacterized protein n=1 Tax=Paenibacillus pinisoli TaxID=1276110 RepID=A0A3A6PI67_9BACL|nr:hypothetical protein [Paenibacillus pinisoli]RJX40907.1 hypothetical protein D3P09_02490 [Paenibacillus pinisoli]
MLNGRFVVELDGQEALMIVGALQVMAQMSVTKQMRDMYLMLGDRVDAERKNFHTAVYRLMADRYELPVQEVLEYEVSLDKQNI